MITENRSFLPQNCRIPTRNGANGKITAPEMQREMGYYGRGKKHGAAGRCLLLPVSVCPRIHLRVASGKRNLSADPILTPVAVGRSIATFDLFPIVVNLRLAPPQLGRTRVGRVDGKR